jgi:GNAT superfamily N-acetyltransferase
MTPEGRRIDYWVTWLEMQGPPERPWPHLLPDGQMQLMRAQTPPVHYFRYLYDMVGGDYHWTDKHVWTDEAIAAFVQDKAVETYVLYAAGSPAGFFMLDFRKPPVCDLSYFGLAPEAIGRGFGNWLLGQAVHMGWERPIERMTVNTCSLDHPRALATYQKWGFAPVRREQHSREIRPGSI